MEDDRTAEAVEHLQSAARELLLAARSFLDVVEEVVEDRDRLAGAASSVVTLLRDGVTGAMPPGATLQPWEQAAWGVVTPDDADASADRDAPPHDAVSPEPVGTSAGTPAPSETAPAKKAAARKAPEKKAPVKKAAAKKAPGKQAATAPAPPRRVRRIAVD